jgi:hypothetical protein
MRERHVTCAHLVQLPQHGDRAFDRVAPFNADERGDLAGLGDPLDVVSRQREFKRLGIAGDHRLDEFDLLDRRRERGAPLRRFARHPDRPELGADASFAQPRDIGLKRLLNLRDIKLIELPAGLLAKFPWQVVVTVDQQGLGVEFASFVSKHHRRTGGWLFLRRQWRGRSYCHGDHDGQFLS